MARTLTHRLGHSSVGRRLRARGPGREAREMENAVCTTPPSGGTSSDLAERKQALSIQRLELCREGIVAVDTADKESWRQIILELLEGGFDVSVLETELAASANTIYKWKSGLAAPREMTRRLLRKAIIEMVDERLWAESHRA